MTEDAELHALQERAAEMVLSMSTMTDDLTDEEARPLIAWAVGQAEAVAREVAAGGARGAAPGAAVPDPAELLADRLTPVRKLVRAVSSLAADRHRLNEEEVAEEIDYVVELGDRLPGAGMRPRTVANGAHAAAPDLARRQAEMDNREFVIALLGQLPQASVTPARAGSPDAPGEVAARPGRGEAGAAEAGEEEADEPAPKALPRSFASRVGDLITHIVDRDDVTDDQDRSDNDDAQETRQRT